MTQEELDEILRMATNEQRRTIEGWVRQYGLERMHKSQPQNGRCPPGCEEVGGVCVCHA